MKKKDWQEYYEFTDEIMRRIESALKIFKGKITKVIIDESKTS